MEEIKGYVDHIVFRNSENGYTVFVLNDGKYEMTCVGTLRTIEEGETMSLRGTIIEHPVYGEQLKVEEYNIIPPSDAISMERYLGSGAIKGIGPALAKRIVGKFKEDTFRIIEQEPERLVEIKGISEKKAIEISSQMEEKKEIREAMIFLQQYGISNTLAIKIYEKYGIRMYQIMKENPYLLADDIVGVGFKIADEIASKIGIKTDSDYRIRSGIFHTILLATTQGHVYLPKEILLKKSSELLEIEEKVLEIQLNNLVMEKKLVIKNEETATICYAASLYYCELNCAKMLHDLNVTMEFFQTDLKKIKDLTIDNEYVLDELQIKAVQEAITNGVFILSGGPGTGKTTTINTMIRFFEKEGLDILLAAPTGRAAKRMTETTGFEAKTIHRLLELNGNVSEDGRKAVFEKNEESPLEADVIIIDEMSMVDIHLFQALLKAVQIGTRLILVGDMNQLPSVGPGQVLADIIKSESFNVVQLKKIYRQEEKSHIIINAHKINEGKEILLDNNSLDFFFLERNDPNVIYKHMIQLIKEKLPSYVNADMLDIQVLTPMRKGSLGVECLNKILQKYLNPAEKSKAEYEYGDKLFRVGDKVMQTKNNYQIEWEILSKYNIPIDKGMGVFNGDVGKIIEINEKQQIVVILFDDQRQVNYSFSNLEEIELAYAITIHKSQGSEYPAIILPILSGPRQLLSRNLLYTGITRAKNCVTLMGSKETIYGMISNVNEKSRYTGLSARIREMEK
ncbi:MAG: SF1B family DNA helicase RecD2 [Lachnospiraceae bacterium]